MQKERIDFRCSAKPINNSKKQTTMDERSQAMYNERVQKWIDKYNGRQMEDWTEEEWITAMMDIRNLTRYEAEEYLDHLTRQQTGGFW